MSVENSVRLIGRLTKNPELTTPKDLSVCKFRLAVDRRTKKDAEKEADFISCTAFGKLAECIGTHCQKGTKIALEGRIQTGSYDKDGTTVYTWDIIVEDFTFCESKKEGSGNGTTQGQPQQAGQPQRAPQGQYQQPAMGFVPQGQNFTPQGQGFVPQGQQYQQPAQGFIPQGQPMYQYPGGQVPVNQLNPNEPGFIN